MHAAGAVTQLPSGAALKERLLCAAGEPTARLLLAQDPDSFSKGKALFASGLLSEAVLALEAECARAPGNVDAWRLLGTVHAENDDDQQVTCRP